MIMRIRTIKPEFWSHPVMARLDDATKLLAIGLLNFADDHGYFYADEKLIRSALRAFDDDSSIVRRSLVELEKTGFVSIRQHPTHGNVGCVTSFSKHQRVDRPKPSEIKELYDSTNDRGLIDDESTKHRRSIDDQSTLEGKGKECNGTGKRRGADAQGLPSEFEEFWDAYPRRVQKGAALKAWQKMKPPIADVLAALQWQTKSSGWTDQDGKFIPYPASYLNDMRWTDEQPVKQKPKQPYQGIPGGLL